MLGQSGGQMILSRGGGDMADFLTCTTYLIIKKIIYD